MRGPASRGPWKLHADRGYAASVTSGSAPTRGPATGEAGATRAVRTQPAIDAPTLAAVYAKRGFTPELDAALATFSRDLLAANVIVGDMHAWNIVYGADSRGGPRLVMIDGFGEKHAIPISSMSRAINRYRTKRLLKRMVDQVKKLVPVES